ncbi:MULTISPECIES: DUF2946 domain-containing protein [unclassified Duganella]|uniref:DUF2946 domain-containing protein n=1 Tax=unclassified Duganella TaxID=2636909 RepID=UPI0008801FA6|nr:MULTISPECIES: DUF2946 domain-containing protein [unclassified Duganella]SDF65634.1 Protein of unknown function [Duganella sp. OV458]SDI63205.1 Protein of unknown function [Duganella sp. OV510]
MLSLIVSMAILLNLFAPAISQAVTPAVLAGEMLASEICSATPLAVSPAGGKRVPGGLHAHGLKHCMLCAVHAGGDAPPPVAAGLPAVLEGHDVYPAPRPAAQRQHSHWSDAQPRGPPARA